MFKKIEINEINKLVLSIQRGQDSATEIKDEGAVLLKNYNRGTTATGNPKVSGTIANKDEAKFNIWYNSPAYQYFEDLTGEFSARVVHINYTVSKYGLVITDIEDIEEYSVDEFIEQKYDLVEQARLFDSVLLASNASHKARKVINEILHLGTCDVVNERFVCEYAAYSHHDNCPSGLLAHTTKCISAYTGLKGLYPFLGDERTNDLMIIGLALHDVGKIFELKDGLYQKYSFITHRGLGLEYLQTYKDYIVNEYDMEFYYMLISIIQQHHGEYGENPRTIYALLVHIIDSIEATCTSIDEILSKNETTTDSSGTKLKLNNTYFNLLSSIEECKTERNKE